MTEIRAVAAGTSVGAAFVADPTADPRPYAESLESLRVGRGPGPTKLSVDGKVVQAAGSEECLNAFASCFDFDDDSLIGPITRHNHVEYFEGNKWIASDSVPLVVSVNQKK
jgi:hypothetical protein